MLYWNKYLGRNADGTTRAEVGKKWFYKYGTIKYFCDTLV